MEHIFKAILKAPLGAQMGAQMGPTCAKCVGGSAEIMGPQITITVCMFACVVWLFKQPKFKISCQREIVVRNPLAIVSRFSNLLESMTMKEAHGRRHDEDAQGSTERVTQWGLRSQTFI